MFRTLQEFYKSDTWKQFRALIIAERTADDGLVYDEFSGKPLIKAYDIIAHHKDPLTLENVNNPEISLNPENIMLVSHASHNIIHNRFGLYKPQRVYIVHGAPLSGKTSFVKSAKGDRDLVVDIDQIWSALTLEDLYIKNDYLKTNIFEVRNNLIDQIATRRGKWETAYIIGSYPKRGERERLAERLGAELIHIDTSKEECLTRRIDSSRPIVWDDYIEQYFESFS